MSSWDKTEALEDGSVIRRNCIFPLVLADSLANSPDICHFFSPALAAKVRSFSPWIVPAASVGLHLALEKKSRERDVWVQRGLQAPSGCISRMLASVDSYIHPWLNACSRPGTFAGCVR